MRAGAYVIAIPGDTCSLIDESYTVSADSLESDTVPRLPGLASDSIRPSGRQRGAYRKSGRDFVRVHLVDLEFDSWDFRTPDATPRGVMGLNSWTNYAALTLLHGDAFSTEFKNSLRWPQRRQTPSLMEPFGVAIT